MAVRFITCPKCGRELEYQSEWAGRKIRCPGCKKRFSAPEDTGKSDDGAIPIYMQKSPEQIAEEKRRDKQRKHGSFLRKVISLLFLALLLAALWWGICWAMFRNSGFAPCNKIDEVTLFCSGHNVFLKAEKNNLPYSGEVTDTSADKTTWKKYVFDGGRAVSVEVFSAENDAPVSKDYYNNGRLIKSVKFDTNGKEKVVSEVEYDFLKRPVKQKFYNGDKTLDADFNYHWYGPLDSVTRKTGETGYDVATFSFSGKPENIKFYENDKLISEKRFEYNKEGMISAINTYNDKGKLIEKSTVSYDNKFQQSIQTSPAN